MGQVRALMALLLVYGGALVALVGAAASGVLAVTLRTASALMFLARVWLAVRSGASSRKGCRRTADAACDPAVWPRVSVLIPAWNEAGTLPHALSSLRNQRYPDWEAIIIAGGTDGTLREARDLCAHDSR